MNNVKNRKIISLTSVFLVITVVAASLMIVNASSPYASAVDMGYAGTEMQMLSSLAAETGEISGSGEIGNTSYDEAVENGFTGTQEEWIRLFVKTDESNSNLSVYEIAKSKGYSGSLTDWLKSISSKKIVKSAKQENVDGSKSTYTLACEYGYSGAPEEWVICITHM